MNHKLLIGAAGGTGAPLPGGHGADPAPDGSAPRKNTPEEALYFPTAVGTR